MSEENIGDLYLNSTSLMANYLIFQKDYKDSTVLEYPASLNATYFMTHNKTK